MLLQNDLSLFFTAKVQLKSEQRNPGEETALEQIGEALVLEK